MKLDAVTAVRAPLPHVGETLTVRVKSLRLEAEVGVYESEHGRKQPLIISFEADVAKEATRPNQDLDPDEPRKRSPPGHSAFIALCPAKQRISPGTAAPGRPHRSALAQPGSPDTLEQP